MSKTTKKKQKSIEELLEEALVLKKEQLYEVPKNWVWTKAGYIAEIIGGGTPKTSENEYYDDGDIPWLTPADLSNYDDMYISQGRRNITDLGLAKSSARMLPENTVLFSSRAPIGYVAIAANPVSTNQGFKSFVPTKAIYSQYLYWYLKNAGKRIEELASGTTFKELSGAKCKEIVIPLPPLDEQKRIAEKVEHLFGKIDEAKQLIDDAKETFELRRAAILDKAYRGELTSKWRKDHPSVETAYSFLKKLINQTGEYNNKFDSLGPPFELPKGWLWIKLSDIADFKNGYAFKSKNFVKKGMQLIRMGNLYKNELNLEKNPVFLPEDTDSKLLEKYSLRENDILLTLTGTKYKRDYGYAVRIPSLKEKLLLNQRILSVTPRALNNYVYFYLQTEIFRDKFFSFETGGVNQGNVGSRAVEGIYFPLPPYEEGREIEKKLSELLDYERDLVNLVDIEQNIESIKQSILNKAFRGKLGTNDPTEESSIELLKEVLKSK
ncbi:restriction endonuclease subunit S [[Bacillus] enclensis]|uniref:restriction endonuclease subunit S n=1 Tax=[Bacillus] enclensis TaxID=1402860 RepID=UPI0018DBFB4E|nr:restriction endonuclease subunit S [[Bacillus] enclensis]MBH9968638.1 restriction endonuclease subunit S [[Bacillus] enclensis]